MKFFIFLTLLVSVCNCTFLPKPKKVYKLPNSELSPGERRDILYHEDTVAIFDVDHTTNVIVRCELIQTKEFNELSQLSKSSLAAELIDVPLEKMLEYVQACDEFDYNSKSEESSGSLGNILQTIRDNKKAGLHGIYLGTKWCGMGDIAGSYSDLGRLRNVDRCCRVHDFCPEKVPPRSTLYNVTNSDLLRTKYHCSCEDIFRDCLSATDNVNGNLIGSLYFNKLTLTCFK